jgi:hypothetical protein
MDAFVSTEIDKALIGRTLVRIVWRDETACTVEKLVFDSGLTLELDGALVCMQAHGSQP